MISLFRVTVQPASHDSEEEITMGLEALKQTPFQSKTNEVLVWRLIEGLVTDRLREYPTSMAEDKRLLVGCNDGNLSNVVQLRRGEKEVLSFYQTMGRRMIGFLKCEGHKVELDIYQPYLESIGLFQDI